MAKLQFYNKVFLPIVYTYEEQALYGTRLGELKYVVQQTIMQTNKSEVSALRREESGHAA